jgi:hypothetical protein
MEVGNGQNNGGMKVDIINPAKNPTKSNFTIII